MTDTSRCDACNKSCLSLLLLRPSPIAFDIRLAAVGSASVLSDADVTNGLLPTRAPTEARFALRLLRPGYVYIFVPKPPKGMKKWLEYRVTEQGDMVPRESAMFAQPTASVTCTRKEHNPTGLKLISIPQAHKIDVIWIAFSANLWNARLRKKNMANPRIMQKVFLAGGTANAFPPTAENLKSKVLECALHELTIDRAKEHEFPFNSVARNVNDLAENLKQAACSHPKTRGHELAIVMRDPVGVATELNELRLRRHELARREMERPENLHPLNSSHTLMGLKDYTVSDGYERAARNAVPICTEQEFATRYKTSKDPAFAGATWEALDTGTKSRSADGKQLGRIWTNANRKTFKEQSKLFRTRNWAQMSSEYDEAKRLRWLADFDKKMKANHFDPLEKFEADWWAACRDTLFDEYFEFHFDEADPNSPHEQHSTGIVYTREVKNALTPAPLTEGRICTSYVQQLTEDVTKPSSVLLRALGANQVAVVAAINNIMSLDTAVGHIHNERNDKLYDFGKELVLGASEAASPNAIQRVLVRYSWLSVALGDVMGGYTLIISKSLLAAVTAVGMRAGAEFFRSTTGSRLLGLIGAVQLIQRTSELALESIVSGAALKTPIQVTKKYPAGVAMHLLSARGGFTYSQVASSIKQGKIELVLLTDNVELAHFNGDLDNATAQGAGRVQLEANQTPSLLQTPATLRTVTLTDSQFEQLWRSRVAASAKAAYVLQEAFGAGKAIFRSLEGRLALGVILINGVGFISSLNKLGSADAAEVRDSWICMTDSAASVLGGTLLAFEVAARSNIAARLGANAVARSVGIHTLRASGFILGAFAGIVTAVGQFAKAEDSRKSGYTEVQCFYIASGTAFFASAVTSMLLAAGAIADRLIARQVASAAAQRMALRFGAEGAAALLGISLSGWGLILMALGVLFEVGAVVSTPTELQKWLQRSYFGYGKGKEKKFLDWNDESGALQKLFATPKSPSTAG